MNNFDVFMNVGPGGAVGVGGDGPTWELAAGPGGGGGEGVGGRGNQL